ncbi:MAG: GNAT family N-acetyltransferase [Saprospiraceae bacterium]
MLDFNDNYILKNDVAALQPLLKTDEKLLFDISNDIEIWTHFEENGFGQNNFHQYINRAIQNQKNQVEYPFIIKDLRTNQYAGMTRIYAVNNDLKNIKIGHTWIGKEFQGTGLNKNCKYLLFEFLFDQLGMERIGFGASAENIHSIKAMESVGCTQEGKLRHFLPSATSQERVDIVLLSILRSEWSEHVKEELKRKISC